FVRSYGFLAYIIPGYLLYAAFLLAEPRYRPDRIFVLCGLIVPFVTLALGLYWIREFETIKAVSPFSARAGRVGLGFIVFFVTGLEVLLVFLLRFLLFFRGRGNPANGDSRGDLKKRIREITERIPAPKKKSQSLRDIYAEAAASMSPDESSVVSAAYAEPTDPAEVQPELREAGEEPLDEIPGEAPAVYSGKEAEVVSIEELPAEEIPDEAIAAEEISPEADDDDVEKALAEASVFAEEEAARHGGKKPQAADSAGKKPAREKKRRLPYFVPVEGILKQYPDGEYWIIDDETRNAALTLKETFKEFNIQVEVTGIRKGPVITMFEILPAPGIRLAKIENLADNIALRLAAQSVRIVAPIPGKHAVGVEVPNARRNIVSFREIIEEEINRNGKKAEVPVILGKDITGEAVTVDLVQMPHLLIAGATGSGKSVCVNSMILTLLYQKPPAECRLILIDPKIVELKLYNDIPHLLTPVITEPKKAFQALQYCIYEMERRYACLDSMGVRDIRSYNRRIKERDIAAEYMPYIVVVIDEFADLMATTGKELESTVARLAAMSRAVGIHLVLATQRPSIDVITGLIKANIPSRIAFMVASKMDSRIIIDMVGAEKLLGKGDMLYAGAVDPFPVRMQGAFVSEEEVERVVDYVKSLGEPDYIDEEIFFDEEEDDADPSLFSDGEDPLYEKALEIVMQQGKASASYIQRRLKIGYNRSARLVEEMEHHGVVGPAQGSKPRELLRGSALN
ncbi:MAG: DNA translocase FtsK, partial [Treponema sp.]|nr:DNA translocase FtsK [Treponema sp.]